MPGGDVFDWLTDSDEVPGGAHVSTRLHGGSAGICVSSEPGSPAGKPEVTHQLDG